VNDDINLRWLSEIDKLSIGDPVAGAVLSWRHAGACAAACGLRSAVSVWRGGARRAYLYLCWRTPRCAALACAALAFVAALALALLALHACSPPLLRHSIGGTASCLRTAASLNVQHS